MTAEDTASLALATRCSSAPDPDYDRLWQQALAELGIADAVFVYQSRYGAARRTYLHGDRIHKLRLTHFSANGGLRFGELAEEFQTVHRCRGLPGIPEALSYRKTDQVEEAAYIRIDAIPLSEAPCTLITFILVVPQIAWILFRLSLRGIAHNDLMPHNVLLSRQGRAYLIDFDVASQTGVVAAFYRAGFKTV